MNGLKIYVSLFLYMIAFGVHAQVLEAEKTLKAKTDASQEGWMKGASAGLNLSQTSLVNWAAGGQNSVAVNGFMNVFANYKGNKLAWDNSLNLGYGLLRQETYDGYMKTDDKIDFLSKIGREAFKNFYYAGLLNFKSQMTSGYNYPNDSVRISNWLAPAYIVGAIGMDYKPNAYLSAFLAPVTGKVTLVMDDVLSANGAFGVTAGEKSKQEFGGYVRMIYSKSDFSAEWLKNVSLTTKADFFSNYLKNAKNVDVNWENIVAMKVNKYISVNFNTHLIYDDDVKFEVANEGGGTRKVSKLQFKEIFGAGITAKF